MKRSPSLLAATVALLLAGCGGGGGIAGASWDSSSNLAEVEAYPAHISPRLRETVQANACGSSHDDAQEFAQRFEDVFTDFVFNIERLDEVPVLLPGTGIEVSFRDRTFVAVRHGEPLISEPLPTVFSMRPPELGIGELGGNPVILLRNRSRSSTGRHFVAIYALDGTALYRSVLVAWQVWDIEPTDAGIALVGCGETRLITAAE
jgi:hypothetical protein